MQALDFLKLPLGKQQMLDPRCWILEKAMFSSNSLPFSGSQDPASRIQHPGSLPLLGLCFFLLLGLVFGCDTVQEIVISGRTMGTTFQVKTYAGRRLSEGALKEKIELRLEELNRVFSTYRPDSEISRFNRFDRTGERFSISDDFTRVMETAARIHRLTDGAWDGTVDPLVRLWGFHDKGDHLQIPAGNEIQAQKKRVSFGAIDLLAGGFLVKSRPDVTLDLASIAKGYAVDAIASLLNSEGLGRHLVEIGGEVLATGGKPDGSRWKVGINRPEKGAPLDSVYRVVALTDRAMATSGDYRNFFVRDGIVYTHVIDPRTGYPVQTGVVSASVTADNCAFADGLATALMVLAPDEGLRLVERLKGVECMLVVREAGGGLSDRTSSGFPSS
jgi:thiamine biosynthesis lipoprotein